MALKELVLDDFDEKFEVTWRQVLKTWKIKEMATCFPKEGGQLTFPFKNIFPDMESLTYQYKTEMQYWLVVLEAKSALRLYLRGRIEDEYDDRHRDDQPEEYQRDPVAHRAHVDTQRYLRMLAQRKKQR